MKYTKFIIDNYKGINHLELDLNIQPENKVYTLVGLNESGKTTILEAINDFEYDVQESQRHLLIPKASAGGFTGDVSIKAELEVSEDDKRKIRTFLKDKLSTKIIHIDSQFGFQRKYSFNNSRPTETKRTYTRFIRTKENKTSPLVYLDENISTQVWDYIKKNVFPEIIYYRDFLSKFPEKIYLDPQPNNEQEKGYLSIIADILTSINPSYDVKSSLLDRLTNPTEAHKQAQEAVENQLGAKISKVVFDAWSKIQNVSKKEIVAKAGQESGRHYIKLSVKEGHQTYAISERSLGFRWFFTFLLYTEFRKERIKTSGEILFLLDEPASNLHQTAQKSLLDTFEKIITKSRLVYTTHSHHLINPDWLSSTYIIKNKGLEYTENDDFNSTKTEIEAFKYKQFVSNYPKQTSYFQPILDVLDYQPGLLEYIPNIVITEGKFDYFIFKLFKEIIFNDNSQKYSFYPGHGATKLDVPIGLYEAWGRKYIVILDSDKEGNAQKVRYIKELSDKEHVVTLEDIDPCFKKITTEGLFDDNERLLISQEFNASLTSYQKSAFNAGIQILYAGKRIPNYISDATKEKFKLIIGFINSKF